MRFFVASWFFPPSTSSEGIVAYKLLRNSIHDYDVCSSVSNKWGYSETINVDAENIKQFLVETESIEEWVKEAIKIFEKENAINPYDAIMTRSMPPEAIEVAMAIKKKHPDLPWIASLGDPLSRIPWMIKNYLNKNNDLDKTQKRALRESLNAPRFCNEWANSKDDRIQELAQYKNWEFEALKNADLVIAPSSYQLDYMLCGLRRNNAITVGHSYDPALYPDTNTSSNKNRQVKELVFLGYANKERTLMPLIKALHHLQLLDPDALSKLRIRLIGNIADNSSSLIYNYYLNDVVSIEGNVSYEESLAIMKNADWLIHVDAYYKQFASLGGSVYFAGKLADYFGTDNPILAITGKGSYSENMVLQAGGLTFERNETMELAKTLERIVNDTIDIQINSEYRQHFLAREQARKLDEAIGAMLETRSDFPIRKIWPPCKPSEETKILSICIPSYNVQSYLDRCLLSLIESGIAERLEVLVINDGSTDKTREIALAYEDHYPGIVKLVDKENGGHGSTINTAIQRATGKYFRVLDGDDWLDPSNLNKFINKLESLEKPVDLISSDYVQVNIKTGALNPIRKKSKEIKYDKIYDIDSIPLLKEYFSMGSITYRTEILRESDLRIQENVFYSDVEYQMMVLPWIKTVLFLSGELYQYAVGNSEQSISRTSFVQRYDDHNQIMKSVISFYYDHLDDMPKNIAEYYEHLIVDHFLRTHFTISLLFDDDRKRGYKRAKEFDDYLKKNHPDLYAKAAKTYPAVANARKYDFNPKQCKTISSLFEKKPNKVKSIARSGVRKIMRGEVGSVVADEIHKRQSK